MTATATSRRALRRSAGASFAALLSAIALTGWLPAAPSQVSAADGAVNLEAPAAPAAAGQATALTLRLPARVAAVEGRVLLDPSAELVGVAPLGDGQTFAPVAVKGGYAFAAYGLGTVLGSTVLRLVIAGNVAGLVSARVLIDAAAGASGTRIDLPRTELTASLQVGQGRRPLAAPPGLARHAPARAAGAARDLFPDGVISTDDLDAFRSSWYTARTADNQCAGTDFNMQADANGDGCVDVVDIQALLAAQGQARPGGTPRRGVSAAVPGGMPIAASADSRLVPTDVLAATVPFVVTSTADTPDAAQGNGVCADSQGRCTLRAAIMEANWQPGNQTISFNLPGAAPVTIAVASSGLPNLGSSTSHVFIDGYSQPGSLPNSAQFGTNAIPGVELRGTGLSMDHILYVPGAGNTIRGLLLDNSYRAIMVDTANGTNNQIIGNWIGFNRDNTLPARAFSGVMLNNGASSNHIGTAALADRNLIGNYEKAIFSYGTGTNGNVIQNNVLCIRPNGVGAACQIAIDHDFGPKNGVVGGSGPREFNVSGPTTLNGYEFSHGWDPNGPSGNYSSTWAVSGHQAIGNWIGFRADGTYDPAYLSAQNVPEVDNGQGVNLHDGAVNVTLDSNYIGAAYDGVTMQMSGTTGCIVRNNIIGLSPRGQPVPMAGWGIYGRNATRSDTIDGNQIHNTANGGIALLDFNIRNIRITKNIVTDTNGPAIYLMPNPNNPSDGANGLMPPPTITTSTETNVAGTGIAGSTVEMFHASRASGQSGLPLDYLGSAVVNGSGNWSLTYAQALPTGQRVAGTQTRSNSETSQLSTNVLAGGPPPPPTADFTWSQTSGTLDVAFTATATGDPYGWSWTFGDGGASTRQNPTWVYGVGGIYTVSLTVTNESGQQTTTHAVNVASIPPGTVMAADAFSRTVAGEWGLADVGGQYTSDGPSSSFNVGGGRGNIVLSSTGNTRGVRLDGVHVRDVDMRVRVTTDKVATGNGQLYAYLVTRANGASAYRPKIIIFPNGSVNVHSGVMVNGNESSMGTSVTVPGLTYTAGRWIWIRAQVTGVNPTTVRVKAWADGTPEPANWQFTATNSAPALQVAGGVGMHTYMSSTSAPTTFSFDDFSAVIPGAPPPPPAANFSSSQQAGTLAVDFTDTSTGSPTAWSWNFGDNTTSTLQNPTHTFATAGPYSVTLTASNAGGPNSITKTVTVNPAPPPPPPTADFTWAQQSGTLNVNFTDASTGAPTAWTWNFGDGGTSTAQSPSHGYAAPGTYSVSLIASNAGGQTSATKSVTVDPLPLVTTYAADAFTRTISGGWGSADSGGAYSLQGTSSNFSVGGGIGSIVVPTAGTTRSAVLGATSARDVDIKFRVRADKVAAGGAYYIYAAVRIIGTSEYRPRLLFNANGTISAQASMVLNNSESPLGTSVVVPGLNQSANGWIWFRAQVIGSGTTTVRVRAWADGTAEPATWNFAATNSAAALQNAGALGLRVYTNSTVTNAPVSFGFDEYMVTSIAP